MLPGINNLNKKDNFSKINDIRTDMAPMPNARFLDIYALNYTGGFT
jgi:hypothetical protein